jgi:hypothetical protein
MTRISKIYLFIILSLALNSKITAQEIRCSITISAQKIQGSSNRTVFETMQTDMIEFVNNRKWTEEKYASQERIECNFFITLDEQVSANEYKGTIQVQSSRPVYNSSYKTTLLNIKDNYFQGKYIESQALEFNETTNKDNLTNILAYYAYIILGIDHDSFSQDGGTEYYQKALAIVNNSQNATESGWKSYESEKNRYWLVENILNKSYSGFRDCLYQYHRQGLDQMTDKIAEGRASVAESLKSIQKVFRTKPSIYLVQAFFDSKSDELINIFSKSYTEEKNRVVTILNECDPSNSNKYANILKTESF